MRLTVAQYEELLKHSEVSLKAAGLLGAGARRQGGKWNDRRVAPREPLETAVRMQAMGEGGELGPMIEVQVRDATPGGVGVSYGSAVEEGGRLLLHLPELAGEPMSIRCVVRSCRSAEPGVFRIGAEFEDVVDCGRRPKRRARGRVRRLLRGLTVAVLLAVGSSAAWLGVSSRTQARRVDWATAGGRAVSAVSAGGALCLSDQKVPEDKLPDVQGGWVPARKVRVEKDGGVGATVYVVQWWAVAAAAALMAAVFASPAGRGRR